MTKSPVRSLANEIGAQYWRKIDDLAFLAAWTRLLADVVAQHTIPQLCKYGDQVAAWADEIMAAPDAEIVAVCKRIHDEISTIDCDDGWPTDKAGTAINNVCLCAICGIGDMEHSRWPAHASQGVWSFATGSQNSNEVVSISRSAWQRHIFSQAMALTQMSPNCEGESDG